MPGLELPIIYRGSARHCGAAVTKMRSHTILMLSANPLRESRLALDREARGIQLEIDRSTHRDRLKLVIWWAAEALDLLGSLRRLEPTIVHFSGHGLRGAANDDQPGSLCARDVLSEPVACQSKGVCFARADGGVEVISPAALIHTFHAAGSSVRLVVLNACYTEAHAHALRGYVDCVIGTRGSIQDEAAINFSIGLYGGLGEGESIARAWAQGRAALSLKGHPDRDCPVLTVRDGIDPDQLVLAPARPRRPRRRHPARRPRRG